MENEKSKESTKHVWAIAGALSILDCFEENRSLSLKELNSLTGMNKSRIMRIAGTLEHFGYLTTNMDTHCYELGARIYSLARHSPPMRENLKRILKPYMEPIVQETGETASFFMMVGRSRLCLLRRESEQSIRFVIQEGQDRPLHKGAPSKVLLAFSPDNVRNALLSDEQFLRAMEQDGITMEDLLRDLDEIRRQRFACSRAEVSQDVFSISAPLFHKNGKLCGALAVSGPTYRLTDDSMQKIIDTLKKYTPLIESDIP